MSTAVHTKENKHEVRERVYPPSEFERVLLMIHEERLVGQVILDVTQGGVRNIRVLEEHKVTESP